MLSLHLDWLNHATHLHFPSDLPCSLQTHTFLNPECCPRIEGALLKSHSDVRTDFSTHFCTQESVNCEHMLFLYICLVSCFMAWARASALLEKGECLRPTRYVLCCTGMLSLQGQTGKPCHGLTLCVDSRLIPDCVGAVTFEKCSFFLFSSNCRMKWEC